ncbi:MAG: glucose-6-phosphate isomerase [Thermoleophilia bacterium]|nr:glucose-6-phosphate isomerase [Thermoleophilia bacterium]
MDRISLDYTLCMESALGRANGLSPYLLEAVRLPLEQARAALEERRRAGSLAWMDLLQRNLEDVVTFGEVARERFETLVVLGIGGSALGTTALARALLHPFHNLLPRVERQGAPRLFVVDNVDPDTVAGLFEHLDLRSTLINVVSKSGSTAETMAVFLVARKLLQEQLGEEQVAGHLVFTTDPYSGVLRKIAWAEGIRAFEIPPGVGGRFSVLSPVGLLPAAIVGLDVKGLLAGARLMEAWVDDADVLGNPAYLFATLQFLHHTRFHRALSVMMPYSDSLCDVADWFRQLWAESLGKAKDRQGRTVHAGTTPIRALGATDQHSQVQLYMEGPDDKLVTFLRVEGFAHQVVIPSLYGQEGSLGYLGGHSLGSLLGAEQEATAWALAERGRPSLTVSLPRVDATSVGQLLYALQVATAVAGELYGVNAYDQPGVELGKKATYALMGRPGFEDLAAEIQGGGEGGEKPGRRYVLA